MNSQRLAIVTGANKGIGFAITEQLLIHPDNYKVVLTSRDVERGKEAVKKLQEAHPESKDRLLYHQLDLSCSKSIEEFVNWIAQEHKSFSILVNNCGIADIPQLFNWVAGNYKTFANTSGYTKFIEIWEANPLIKHDPEYRVTEENIKKIIRVNLLGLIELTEKLLPYLSDDGKIISTSSLLGELQFNSEEVRKKHTDPNLDREKFFKLLEEYEEAALKGEQSKKLGYIDFVSAVTKIFLNTYTRKLLPKLLKENQAGFVFHPGWIQTDLGGSLAPKTLAECHIAAMKIVNFSVEESKKNNGNYFWEDGNVRDF